MGRRIREHCGAEAFLDIDPLYNKIPDEGAKERLIAVFSPELTRAESGFAIGYEFDIVLAGPDATPADT